MKSEKERLCESCIHYQRLYAKKPNRLMYAGRGYCIACRHTERERNLIPRLKHCEHFSRGEGRDLHCEEDMKRVLCDMAKSLADIALMLGAEEQEDEE